LESVAGTSLYAIMGRVRSATEDEHLAGCQLSVVDKAINQ